MPCSKWTSTRAAFAMLPIRLGLRLTCWRVRQRCTSRAKPRSPRYTFFEQCPHRMACARCDFYTPKGTSKGQLLEAKDNLQRMLANIPLTDDERAAVDDGQAALDHLLGRLADVPTPAGATPRQLGASPAPTLLPIIEVRQGKQG